MCVKAKWENNMTEVKYVVVLFKLNGEKKVIHCENVLIMSLSMEAGLGLGFIPFVSSECFG